MCCECVNRPIKTGLKRSFFSIIIFNYKLSDRFADECWWVWEKICFNHCVLNAIITAIDDERLACNTIILLSVFSSVERLPIVPICETRLAYFVLANVNYWDSPGAFCLRSDRITHTEHTSILFTRWILVSMIFHACGKNITFYIDLVDFSSKMCLLKCLYN